MINKKMHVWSNIRESELASDGQGQSICQNDDYEFLDNIDFLQHIDMATHNTVHYLTNDMEEEDEEIAVKVDFLEDLTFFDELDYFDELNKALEREVSELSNKEDSKWERVRKCWSRVTAKKLLAVAGMMSALMLTSIGISLTIYLVTRPSESHVSVEKQVTQNSLGNDNPQIKPSVKPSQDSTLKPSPSTVVKTTEPVGMKSGEAGGMVDDNSKIGDTTVVNKSFFDDTVFIGNSLTVGLQMNSNLSNATFLAAKSLNIATAFDSKVITEKGTKNQLSILEALEGKAYNKIYIMFGTNELGWPSAKVFGNKYAEFVEEVQKLQPGAQIYIQSILPVSKSKSDSSSIYTNGQIDEFNKELEAVAARLDVNYLDVSKSVADEQGALPEDASADGVHLKKSYCQKWLSYIEKNS